MPPHYVLANATFAGGATVINHGSGSVTLNGISPGQLTAGDFISPERERAGSASADAAACLRLARNGC
jgi:hypothetical protein